MADCVPVVPLLDALMPLVVDQQVEALKILDTVLPDVEQVIEVPKISLDVPPPRAMLREPLLAEHFLAVPGPETVVLARGGSAAGVDWYRVAAP